MTNSDIEILPCILADGASIGRLKVTSFWTDPSWAMLWPGKTCEYVAEQGSLRTPRALLDDPDRNRHLKAVDRRTGKIVGYARWVLPRVAGVELLWPEAVVPPAESPEALRQVELKKAGADWHHDSSFDGLDILVKEARGRWLKPGEDIILEWLSVDSDYRHQGIATKLTNCGIAQADQLGLNTYVYAKQAGRGVYLRTGFEVKEELIQDNSKYGGTGKTIAYVMRKESVIRTNE